MEKKPDAAARLRAGAVRNDTPAGGKDERCGAPEAALQAGADRNDTPGGGKGERCGAPEAALQAGADRNDTPAGGKDVRCGAPEAALQAGADRNGTPGGGKGERCGAPEAALRAGADRNDTPGGGKDVRCGAPQAGLQAGDTAGERRDIPGGPAAGRAGRRRTLAQLFFATLYISACTFGGGFVIVTFMKRRFVDRLHWIDEQEMLDLTALAQSSPGAIAVNAAILVGWRVAGFAGMLVATLGTILPPMLILSAVSLFYHAFAANRYVALALKGMQAGVAAVILDVVCNLGGPILRQRSPLSLAVMAAAFVASFFFNVNVVFIILAAALVGVGQALRRRRRGEAQP